MVGKKERPQRGRVAAGDEQPQLEVNNVAAALTAKRNGDTSLSSGGDESARPARRQRALPYSDSSLELGQVEMGSYRDSAMFGQSCLSPIHPIPYPLLLATLCRAQPTRSFPIYEGCMAQCSRI